MSEPLDRERIVARLAELRDEHEQGAQLLEHLEGQANETRATMLRIAGAIAMCEELLLGDDPPS